MNWQEALEEIHSVGFDANLNMVSGTNSFFGAVAREPAVLGACRQMLASGEVREDALGRIHRLVREKPDPVYENPNDTPLAVLLWLTTFAAPDYAEIAATWVERAPQCWYAKKLAHRILNPPSSSTGNYQTWGSPDEATATDTRPPGIAFMWAPITEEPPRIYGVNLRSRSSIPATTWRTPNEVVAAAREGKS